MPELLPAGSPIRRPAGRRVCAPNRGLSQLAASFIGFLCQGIRRAPVISSRCRLISAPRGRPPGRREHTGRGFSPRRPDAHCYYPYIRIVSINPCTCRRIDIRSSLCQYRYRIVISLSPDAVSASGLAMRLSRYAGRPRGPDAAGKPGKAERAHLAVAIVRYSLRLFPWKLSLPRKEVIQPHVPVRLPCYDFTPLTLHTFDASPPCGLGRRLRVQTTRVV